MIEIKPYTIEEIRELMLRSETPQPNVVILRLIETWVRAEAESRRLRALVNNLTEDDSAPLRGKSVYIAGVHREIGWPD